MLCKKIFGEKIDPFWVFINMKKIVRITESDLVILVNKVINEYARLLNSDVNHNNKKVPVWKYFGTEASTYNSTSANSRWDKIFQYVFQNVDSDIKNRSKDRDLQAEYRENVLKRTASFIESESMVARLKLFPLSTDNIYIVNFSNG